MLCCDHVLLCQELVRSFHACNKSKFRTSVPDSGGGGDSPLQSIPTEDAKPKKSLHTVPSSASLYGTDIMVEEHRLLVESIARHIVYGESSLYGTDVVAVEEHRQLVESIARHIVYGESFTVWNIHFGGGA